MTMKQNHGKVGTHRAIWAFSLPLIVFMFLSAMSVSAQTLSFSTSGGVGVTGPDAGGNFHTSLGTFNGLGLGAAPAGYSLISSNFTGPGGVTGALYSTSYAMTAVDGNPNRPSAVTAAVTTNFAKPAAIALYSCPVAGACGAVGGYVQMSTNIAAPTTVWAGIPAGGAGPATANLGVFISSANGNGASAFSGTDATNVTIQYTLRQTVSPNKFVNVNLVLDTLKLTVQNAVSLGFAQGATTVGGGAACGLGGSVVVGSASDVSFNLGPVDGLGIHTPTCGGTVSAIAVGTTSATYATAYKITPAFSGITTSPTPTATIALTSAGFTNSGTLSVQEGSSAAAMASVPTSGSTHIFTTTVSNVAIERFIGLTILNNNSGIANRFPNRAAAGPFTASADAALVTFTMTVF